MPDKPASENTVYTRTLQRAADTVGGVERLAELLELRRRDLERWVAGESRPPQDVFLAALDIVAGGSYSERSQPGHRPLPQGKERT